MQRRLSILALALCITLPLPVAGVAAGQDGGHGMDMQAGMNMDSNTVFSETATVDGVRAKAQLMDTREAMAKAGMEATHHFMINFFNEQNGAAIENGAAAVKVTLPSGEETKARKMMGMAGGFGADLTLKEPGSYTFTVGTKLADGQKRQFVFNCQMK
jgi:hypothetical protein